MINCLLQEWGGVFQEKVFEIVSVLCFKFQEVQGEYVLLVVQYSVYFLVIQYCVVVVFSFLGSFLFLDSYIFMLWWVLVVEFCLVVQVLGLLLEKMSRDVLFKESWVFLLGCILDCVVMLLFFLVICVLFEVLFMFVVGFVVLEFYFQLFVVFLLCVSCIVGVLLFWNLQIQERRGVSLVLVVRNLEFCSFVVDILWVVLFCSGSEDVVQCMDLEGGWELFRILVGYEEGVIRLVRVMVEYVGFWFFLVLKMLVCIYSSVYENQRVIIIVFLVELLNSNVVNDLMFLDLLLESLVVCQKDICVSV